MKIDVRAIDEFLPFYVPAIVTATMATCEACALDRQPTPAEIDELSEKIAEQTYLFMRNYKTLLKANGADINENEYNELCQSIYESIFVNASLMIERAAEEMKKRIKNNENGKMFDMRQNF